MGVFIEKNDGARPCECVRCRLLQGLHPPPSPTKPLDVLTLLPRKLCLMLLRLFFPTWRREFLTQFPGSGGQFQLEDAQNSFSSALEATQGIGLPEATSPHPKLLVQRMFGSFLRSRALCSSCQVLPDAYEPFLDVLLDIKEAASLKEALQNLLKPKLLGARRCFRCQNCGQVTFASRKLLIHGAPQILALRLQRFEDLTGTKISKVVKYPEDLDLGPYLAEASGAAQFYSLYAVLVHSGENYHTGHYFCYTKARNGIWYKLENSSVIPCDKSTVLQQEAHLLFYARCSDFQTDPGAFPSMAPPLPPPSIHLSFPGNPQNIPGHPQSVPFGPGSPHPPFPQNIPFGAATTPQLSQVEKIWESDQLGMSGTPLDWECSNRTSRKQQDEGLVQTEPGNHPVLDPWEGDEWQSFAPRSQIPRKNWECFVCRRERRWLIHMEPHHHFLHSREEERRREKCQNLGFSNFFPTTPKKSRSRSPLPSFELLENTDSQDGGGGKRMRNGYPSAQEDPELSLKIPAESQEKIPRRKSGRSRFPRQSCHLCGKSMDSAGKRRRNPAFQVKKKEEDSGDDGGGGGGDVCQE
ncbi:uncharacterized protein [Heliangelus exortis]|uniref:uncharacterized protein n=1 Tax=Heliangelus exortis TaxID=472823 RepID=UPI003A8CA86B